MGRAILRTSFVGVVVDINPGVVQEGECCFVERWAAEASLH